MELILDNIRSGNNIGSLFRTSDALGIEKIWLTGICATPPNKEILKSALGACDSIPWEYYQSAYSLCDHLLEQDYTLLALEQSPKSILLQNFEFPNKKIALVLGNEVEGVSPEILDKMHAIVEIPQFGIKKSLNVAVSAGMILWQWKLQNLKSESSPK